MAGAPYAAACREGSLLTNLSRTCWYRACTYVLEAARALALGTPMLLRPDILNTHKEAIELCYDQSCAAGHQGAVLVLDSSDYRLAPLINSLGMERPDSPPLDSASSGTMNFGIYGLPQEELLKVAELMKIQTIIEDLHSPPPSGKFYVLFAIAGVATLKTMDVPPTSGAEES